MKIKVQITIIINAMTTTLANTIIMIAIMKMIRIPIK